MSIASTIRRFLGSSASAVNGSSINYDRDLRRRTRATELPARSLYALLKSMYLTNGTYEDLRGAWSAVGVSTANLKAIRNVVAPVVDVLGSKLYPEPLIVTTPRTASVTSQQERAALEARDPIKAAIEQVWQWSNWSRSKRKHARWTALYGEAFIKVVSDIERQRVHFELLEPQYVTDYTLDERDYVTMCRLDIQQSENTPAGMHYWTHTEYWSQELGTLRIWKNDGDVAERRIEDLGQPVDEIMLSDFGIGFVPIVRTPFREIDNGRAIGAVQLAIEAIVEADLCATNLHEMIYTDAEGAWVLKAVGVDANNRPLPPPRVAAAGADGENGRQSDDSVMVGKRSFWRLGGNQELQSVIPDIQYDAALAILQDHDTHLERLMPALTYVKLSELTGGDLSGKAITYKMRAFQDQVEEVRANVLASLKQANMMALTMGVACGAFRDLGGTYESGAFEHDFEDQPILAVSSIDDAEEQRSRAQAAQSLLSAGLPMSFVLTDVMEVSEERAAQIVAQAADDAEAAMERAGALVDEQLPAQTDEDDNGEAA